MTEETPFDIIHAPGLESVAEAFRANFSHRDDDLQISELGAQFSVYRDGVPLLDFKGGWADRAKTRPVDDKTLMAVYSSGKTAAALVIAWLADQDRLGYDQIVATLWPDFAQQGKGALTIAQVMSHQAGLSGITDRSWTPEDWYDWEKTCAALAAQEPIFPPGTASGYHPVTYGFLAGEIARLADAEMRTLGTILREDICMPNELDIHIGLPPSEHVKAAAQPRVSGQNLVLPFDLTFGAGIMHNAPNMFYGPTPSTLGHSGWGGSCVFADPVTGLHGCYAMNRQDKSLIGDPRAVKLIDALYAALY